MEMRGEKKIDAEANRIVGVAMTLLLLLSGLNKIPRAEPNAIHWQLAKKYRTHTL